MNYFENLPEDIQNYIKRMALMRELKDAQLNCFFTRHPLDVVKVYKSVIKKNIKF